jgi:hypothetical protein
MADTTVTNIDQNNNSGTLLERFKVKFSGLVLAAFQRKNIMRQFVWEKDSKGAKSASFPAVGLAKVNMHITRGQDIFDSSNSLLSQTKVNDVLVKVDRPMISAAAVDISDDLMSDDVQLMHVANGLSESLSRDIDRKILQAMVLGARASTNITDTSGVDAISGGTQLEKGATIATSESVIRAAIIEAAQTLDENDAPSERYAVLSPALYHLLLQNSTILGAEYGKVQGVDGKLLNIHGITILMSKNVPSTVIASTDTKFGNAASAGNQNVYYGDFSDTVGLVFAGQPAGGALLRDLSTWIELRDEQRMSHKMKVDFIGGFGYIRPESLVELSKATAT